MPDFDPKSIPILDDVIEDVKDASSAIDDAPALKAASDALANDSADIPDADSEAFESALIDYDTEQVNHTVEVETNYEPFKYQQQVSEDPTRDKPYVADAIIEQPIITAAVEKLPTPNQAASEQLSPLQKEEQSADIPCLQTITDEIVKQLMPDLETQLRHLIQQALEGRLPKDAIRTSQLSTPDDD